MTASSKLTRLQTDIIDAFFALEQHFFLTGGAALAGYYLKHRQTDDLDLFATEAVSIERGSRALRAAAEAAGARVESLQESQDFRRFAVRRGKELTVVDLVIDRAPQAMDEKAAVGRVRMDPIREIAANKLCTLLDRMEVRDLVDLKLLLAEKVDLEQTFLDARRKHAGVDPGTLAWLLGQFHVPDTHDVLAETGITARDLDSFRETLIDELAAMALPPE